MPTTAPTYLVSEQDEKKPVVGISRISSFLGRSLAQILLDQNCVVVGIDGPSASGQHKMAPFSQHADFLFINADDIVNNKELISKIQYFFALVQEEDDYKKLVPFFDSLNANQTKKVFIKEIVAEQHDQILEKIVEKEANSTGIYLFSVYGPGMEEAGAILSQFQTKNQGIQTPVFISDAVYALSRAMFGQTKPGKTYFISGGSENQELNWKPRISLPDGIEKTKEWLDAKNIIQKPKEILLSETENQPVEDLFAKPTHELFFETKPTEEGQSETTPLRAIPKATIYFKRLKQINFIKPPKPIIIFMLIFFLTTAGILLPLSLAALRTSQGVKQLTRSQALLNQGKIKEAKIEAQKTEQQFIQTQKILNNINILPKPAKAQTFLDQIYQKIQIAVYFSRSLQHLANAFEEADYLLKTLRGNQETNTIEKTLEVKKELILAEESLSQVEAGIKNPDFKSQKQLSQNFSLENIHTTRKEISIVGKLFGFFPSLTAQNGKKSYLVLLQDNLELRPTGGFIGSYALITFESGRLFDAVFEDVFTADNQLKGQVWPPAPISKYLGQPSWYLRDANWDPDFPTSAQKAEWFFTKETGKTVDGVIAIDNTAIQYILAQTGPLEIPEYLETIDSKNFMDKSLARAEINASNKEGRKRNFLGIVSARLWEKIVTLPVNQWPQIFGAILQGLEEKHIQLFIQDQPIQKVIIENKWSGQINSSVCPVKNCIFDYFFLVDSNLGANKGNYYLKRRLQKEVNIDNYGQIFSEAIISLENTSPINTWPGGAYKTYLRVLVPQETKLLQVKIDGKIASFSARTETETQALKPGEFNIDIATEGGTPVTLPPRTSFGFFLEIPIKTAKTVSLLYKLPQTLDLNYSQARYQLSLQKQGGTGYDPAIINIGFPQLLKPQKNSPEMVQRELQLKYTTDLSIDRNIFVDFTK